MYTVLHINSAFINALDEMESSVTNESERKYNPIVSRKDFVGKFKGNDWWITFVIGLCIGVVIAYPVQPNNQSASTFLFSEIVIYLVSMRRTLRIHKYINTIIL